MALTKIDEAGLFGNITLGNVTVVGNATMANISASNFFFANGTPFVSGGGTIYTVSNTAPTGSHAGDQWYDPSADTLYTYVNNGTSYFWLDISSVAPGPVGYTGSVGSGYTGSAGTNGYTGSSGTNGYTGSVGTTGYTGSAGTNGYTGSAGTNGYTGSSGSFDGTTSSQIITSNSTASTSTTTGALQVSGGAGVAGNVYAGAVYTNSLNLSSNNTAYTWGLHYQQAVYGTAPLTSFTIANNPSNGLVDSTTTFTSATADFEIKFEVLGSRPSDPGQIGIGYYNVTTNTRQNVIEYADYAAYGPSLYRKLINYAYGTWASSDPFRLRVVKSGTTLTWTFLNTSDVIQITDTNTLTVGQTYKIYFYYEKDTSNDSQAVSVLTDTQSLFTSDGILVGTTTGFTSKGNVGTVLIGQGNAAPTFSSNLTLTGNVVAGAVYTNSYFYANGTAFTGGGGYTGSSGSGYTGSAGTNGYAGSIGYSGSAGYTGSAGTNGYAGSIGYSGSAGYTGSIGSTGYTGSIGTTGNAGIVESNVAPASTSVLWLDTTTSGGTGYTGSAGAGYTGSNGYTGSGATVGIPTPLISQTFTGNGVQTAFTLSDFVSATDILVTVDTVVQVPTLNYTVNGLNLTFDTAPSNGSTINIRTFGNWSSRDGFVNLFTGNGAQTTFTLTGSSISSRSMITFVDGIYQIPDVDFYTSGSQLTFYSAPDASSNVVVQSFNNTLGTEPIVADPAGISVGNTTITLDSFSTTLYRTAKYIISVSSSNGYQCTEAMLVHNGTSAQLVTYAIVYTGNAQIMSFSANIVSNLATLYGNGVSSGNTVKMQRTYIKV